MRILYNGEEVPLSGAPPSYVSGYGIVPIANFPPAEAPRFPLFLQWQKDGVDAGEPNVRVVNIITGNAFRVSRGTGEKANVITIAAIVNLNYVRDIVSLADEYQTTWTLCANGFYEDFSSGAAPYFVTDNTPPVFQWNTSDTYGASLSILGGPSTGFASSAYQDITTTGTTKIDFRFRVDLMYTTGTPDDAPSIVLYDGVAVKMSFSPAREKYYDSAQRPHIQIDGGTYYAIGTTYPTPGTWYAVHVEIVSGSTVQVTITDIVAATVWASLTISGTFVPWNFTRLNFHNEFSYGGADHDPGCTYDEVLLC